MMGNRVCVVAALAGFAGLILGILVTVALQSEVPAQQSGDRRIVIHPEKSPKTGLPFSPGILVGNILYVSGHLGRDPVTTKLVSGGIEAETRQVLANIHEVLRAAGMDFKDVVSVTAYITSFEDFAKFNEVYREFFPNDPPARATVQVAALNVGARIELQMIAVKP
ncbi:MAG: Rid family detoxifying hydrolase [Nitrospira sp.]|nr:Rid family detoxifying hydrolase [Nitrospira sp.]